MTLSMEAELVLVDYIRVMSLAGFPPSVGMVKEVAEEIDFCDRVGKFDPTCKPPSFGLNYMARLQRCHPSIKAMYTCAATSNASERSLLSVYSPSTTP